MVEGIRKDKNFQVATTDQQISRKQDSINWLQGVARSGTQRKGVLVNDMLEVGERSMQSNNRFRSSKESSLEPRQDAVTVPRSELTLTQGTQGQQPDKQNLAKQQNYDQILARIHNDRQTISIQKLSSKLDKIELQNARQQSVEGKDSTYEQDISPYNQTQQNLSKLASSGTEHRKNSSLSQNGISIVQSLPQKSSLGFAEVSKAAALQGDDIQIQISQVTAKNKGAFSQTQQVPKANQSQIQKDQIDKDYPYVAKIIQSATDQAIPQTNINDKNLQLPVQTQDNMVMSVVVPPERNKKKNVLVNTSHCRAEIDTVQYVVNKFGYREAVDRDEGNLIWYGIALRDGDIDWLKTKICMINRYPLMDHFAKKNIFCVIVSRLQRFFPQEYRFMPDSFLLPDEIQDLEIHMRHFPNQTFICKPSRGRGGEGITLLRKFTDLPKNAYTHEYLIQRYIENPLLISGKKFDIRLYVVIKGVEQIEAYVCEEGLARFCTSNYKRPDGQNMKNLFMHLTNYSLNKQSEKFKTAGADFADINSTASKQLLSSVFKKLQAKGRDIRLLKKNIDELTAKTVIALEPYLKNAYHCFISTDHESPRCFQILGLDILMDENWNCWLMEVNANPSLNVYNDKELPNGDIEQTLSEIDKYVKTSLIADTIALVTTAPLYQQKKPDQGEPIYKSATLAEQGNLRLVLPHPQNSKYYDQLYMYSKAEKIFENLAGQKSYDFITANQFQRLAKFQNMTNQHLQRSHYDLIFKNVIRRSENSQMDLNCFFEALEDIASRLYQNKRNTFENLTEIIANLNSQL